MATDDQLLEKAIIIVGAPRSGTTLMAEILGAHSSLAYADEPRLIWRQGNDTRSDALRREDARPEVRARIRARLAELVRTAGRSRLLEKSPQNSLRLDFVDAVLPGCRFVHIVRNGYDSVLGIRSYWQKSATGVPAASLFRRLAEIRPRQLPHYARELVRRVAPGLPGVGPPVWGPRLPGIDQLVREFDLLDVCCLQWRSCVEAACQAGRLLPPDRYLELRLEDVSEALVTETLQFCGLDDEPGVWEEFRKVFKPGLTAARSANADPRTLERIRRWIEPTNRWLGYE